MIKNCCKNILPFSGAGIPGAKESFERLKVRFENQGSKPDELPS